jgi:hypothetical protein
MYIAIDRKPENGCEIQNSACGDSGVMLRLKLVMGDDGYGEGHGGEGAESDDDDGNVDAVDGVSLSHGGRICVELVEPWLHSDRIVCADSYFASVSAALAEAEGTQRRSRSTERRRRRSTERRRRYTERKNKIPPMHIAKFFSQAMGVNPRSKGQIESQQSNLYSRIC